ncbi:hypothetical protein ACLOJK_002722 [Asimina triloba]
MDRLISPLENKDVLVEDVISVMYWLLNATRLLPIASEWEATQRISLSHNRIKTLPLLPNSPHLSTLFLNDNILLQQISDEFFRNMKGLLVLDLSNTPITSMPSSLSCLRQLRMLLLRNCKNLELLPGFLNHHLQKLEILNLEDTPLPGMLEASFDGMMSRGGGAAANLTQLSVRGCRSLTKLMGLDEVSKLVELDL